MSVYIKCNNLMFLVCTLCFTYNLCKNKLWGGEMLVHRIRISNSIDKKLYEELKKLSEETKVPMSKLLDEAIEDLLKKRK